MRATSLLLSALSLAVVGCGPAVPIILAHDKVLGPATVQEDWVDQRIYDGGRHVAGVGLVGVGHEDGELIATMAARP